MASIAEILLSHSARNGGATVSLTSGEPASHTAGYYVGGEVKSVILPLEPTLVEYELAVEEIRDAMHGIGYIGSWRSYSECLTYIDGTNWYEDAETALSVGKLRGELEVWDIAGGTGLIVE